MSAARQQELATEILRLIDHEGHDKDEVTLDLAYRLAELVVAAAPKPAEPRRDAMTPEQHHDRLMDAIEHEIRTYGVASLAGLIASQLAGYVNDQTDDRAVHYRTAQFVFEELEGRLAKLPRPFDLPDTAIEA